MAYSIFKKNMACLKKQNSSNNSLQISQNINIRTILNKRVQGQAILQSYKKKNKTLSRKLRNFIVVIVLSDRRLYSYIIFFLYIFIFYENIYNFYVEYAYKSNSI
ncbi:hypothetical protein PUN28_019434 [Cardiocondyla obscurior]|uniref:Transmembrane protein n=1 Tax=Cardiocondyla obscurior TaxID=286306 RepID=A0AAW2EC83_9HYME